MDKRYSKILLITLLCWAILWTVLPCLVLNNDFVDVLENIVWGKHWELGYDKNPYLGAWFGYSLWIISGKAFFSSFLGSQIFVCTGIFSVWLIARHILPERTAFLAAISLLAINFYGIKAVELCDDVMELGLWPLTMLFVYLGVRGEEKKKPFYWLAAGFFAGASLMVKYFAPALLVSLGIPLLFTAEGRKCLKKPSFYLSLIPFLLLVIPNIIWLTEHQGKPLEYAAGRAGLEHAVAWSDHFLNPLSAINRAFGVIVVMFVPFAVTFFMPEKKADRVQYSSFDRVYTASCCWGPFVSALLFSLVTGGNINYSWAVPCFPFFAVWLFMTWQPKISERKTKIYTIWILATGVFFLTVFAIRTLEHQGYRKRGCDYENCPGKQLAANAELVWRERVGGKIPYVIGSREYSCNIAVYSTDAPAAFFDADPTEATWINLKDVDVRGCILVWDGKKEKLPEKIAAFRSRFPQKKLSEVISMDFERSVPDWYRRLRGPAPKHQYNFQIVYPERN